MANLLKLVNVSHKMQLSQLWPKEPTSDADMDLLIKEGGKLVRIAVDRCILVTACPILARICSTFTMHEELGRQQVILTEVKSEAVRALVQLIYMGECSLQQVSSEDFKEVTMMLGFEVGEVTMERKTLAKNEGTEVLKKAPQRKPTVVDEMVPKSSGKKRRNCLLGEDCLGCPAPECGECKHCLDKPSRGGRGTLKQKCILRKCRLDNASLDSASGSDMDVKA